MPVRVAAPDDLDEICMLIGELAVYERLEDEVAFDKGRMRAHLFGPDPAAHVLMAVTEGGEVAGMALWYRTFSTFLGTDGIWLEDLFVRPAYRNRGYGRDLLNRLRELTEGRVEWAVLDWNAPAIDFYRTLGASPVEGWTRYRWLR